MQFRSAFDFDVGQVGDYHDKAANADLDNARLRGEIATLRQSLEARASSGSCCPEEPAVVLEPCSDHACHCARCSLSTGLEAACCHVASSHPLL